MKILKNIIKCFLPYGVILLHRKQSCHAAVKYTGNYTGWEAAARASEGYDAEHILEKVKSATKKVLEGKAVFERDSVLFCQEDPNYPLISNFLYAGKEKQQLNVLDFGGSLGSVYFQNRKFLSSYESISWRIVEQKHYVKAGQELFRNHNAISFFETIEMALDGWKPDVILLSSVLQYIPDHETLLRKIKAAGCRYIFIDRLLLFKEKEKEKKHRFCVQQVSPEIYEATYPVQVFQEKEILDLLSPEYQLIDKFQSYPGDCVLQKPYGIGQYWGLIFTLKAEKED